MALNSNEQPVALGGTVGGSIQAAIAAVVGLLAMFFPAQLPGDKAAALIGATGVIVTAVTTIWQQRRAWSPSSVSKVAVEAARTGDAASAVEAHQ